MSALSALELSDLKLLNNAVFSAMNKKESEMTRSKIGAAAAKMTPSFLSKKIKRSLDSYNWDWVGEFGTDEYEATFEATEAIKPGASSDFKRDLSYVTSDVSSDTFRKMSRPVAIKAQKNAMANMQKLVSELQ